MKCQICDKEYKQISKHLSTHNISPKEYYDKYLKQPNEDICPVCGKSNNFKGLTKGYTHHCSLKCKGKDPEVKHKVEQTCLERFGSINVYSSNYGREKVKSTMLNKYGTDNPQKIKSVKEKTKQTKLEKYGSETYNNSEKAKQTCLDKYGVKNPYQIPEVKEKSRKNLHSEESDNKRKQTLLKHHGVTSPLLIPDVVNKAQKNSHTPEALEKQKQTNLERYGVECPFQREDVIEKTHSEEVKQKRRQTLHKNGTYGKSQAEDKCYDLLQSIFPNAVHHYTSDIYPFECDMYVPELDLYIECHFFWTHGGHFFDKNNPEDLATVEEWKSKHTNFYDSAIQNWTVRDLEKLECAHRNNLNYLVFWSEKEFLDWLKTI